MTAQTFQSVFRKISLSASVQEAFRESIVQKLAIHKKEHMVSMKISASRLIPLDKWDALREELLRNLPGIHSVEVAAVYNLPEDAPEFLAETYWDTIRQFSAKKSKVCAGIVADAEWKVQDGKMLIFVKNNMAYYLARKKLDEELSHMIFEETGQQLLIQFKNTPSSAEERERLEKERENKTEELLRQIVTAPVPSGGESNSTGNSTPSFPKGVLFGKECNGSVSKIVDTKIVGENVTIEGNIFNVESREIKGDKYIVSFDMTDLSDSTTVKFFVKKTIFDGEMTEKL